MFYWANSTTHSRHRIVKTPPSPRAAEKHRFARQMLYYTDSVHPPLVERSWCRFEIRPTREGHRSNSVCGPNTGIGSLQAARLFSPHLQYVRSLVILGG